MSDTKPSSDTLAVLRWAAASDEPIVRTFWGSLCEAVSEPESASADKVLSELRAYGGNTIANIFRSGDGVPYPEVVYDVADTLRSAFADAPYREGDVENCERFVLKAMEVTEDNVSDMCRAISSKAINAARAGISGAAAKVAGARIAGQTIGRVVAEQAAKCAAAEAAKRAAESAAKAAGKRAASAAAKAVTRLAQCQNADLQGPQSKPVALRDRGEFAERHDCRRIGDQKFKPHRFGDTGERLGFIIGNL
jgi:hypothetical protein